MLKNRKDNFFFFGVRLVYFAFYDVELTAKIYRKTYIEMNDLGHYFFSSVYVCICVQITSFIIFNFNLEDKTNKQLENCRRNGLKYIRLAYAIISCWLVNGNLNFT